ncbi:LacI family DNA-binding transcriptional regulator [Neobacillus niacini]|uniref:LacI family DNA-binding transcriptional regulator n=1 Tax=Neobacillus niacini TaxID=86668 RepID=UPI002FFEAB03
MATIKDIANLANVSITTVSRVLNYDETLSVSPKTRKGVFEAAEELAYVITPKKKPKSKWRIGLYDSFSLEEELVDTYYLSIRVALEKKLKSKCIDFFRIEQEGNEENLRKIDGIICLGTFKKRETENIKDFQKLCVFVDSNPDEYYFDSVVIDFNSATKNALNYLTQLGHENIGFIGGVETDMYGNRFKDLRQDVFENYLKEKGIFKEELVKIGGYDPKDGYTNLREMLSADPKPTAVFVANDTIAVGCYKAAYELGIKIPDELSIVGFNDVATAQYMVPPLTTVKLYTEIMGETAVDLLLERLASKREVSKKITINTKLIVRESAAKPQNKQ